MAKKPETLFKEKVAAFLKELPYTFAIKIQQLSKVGDPDFVICVRGQYVAMELKKSIKDRAKPLQLYKLEKVRAAQGIGLVVYPENWQDTQQYLKILADAPKA